MATWNLQTGYGFTRILAFKTNDHDSIHWTGYKRSDIYHCGNNTGNRILKPDPCINQAIKTFDI
jgi:hypothetical protein